MTYWSVLLLVLVTFHLGWCVGRKAGVDESIAALKAAPYYTIEASRCITIGEDYRKETAWTVGGAAFVPELEKLLDPRRGAPKLPDAI